MALNLSDFNTTLGTSPASWYPIAPTQNNAAAAPVAAPGIAEQAATLGIAPSNSGTPSSPGTAAPPLSLGGDTPSDFASLFPYLKLGLSGAGYAGLPGTGLLGGLLNLGAGGATGNPAQLGQGALSAVSGANSLFNSGSTLGGLLDAPIGSTLSSAMPAVSGALSAVSPYLPLAGAALAGLTANQTTPQGQDQTAQNVDMAMLASTIASLSGLTGPIGAFAGPVLGVALALNQALNPPNAWPGVAKAVTGMEESSLKNMTQAGGLFDQLKSAGVADPSILERALTMGSNALFPSYQKIQNPNGGAYGVSDYFGHTKADQTAYNAAQTGLQGDLWNTILGLHNTGVSNATLGGLPVNAGWGDPYLGGTAVGTAISNLYPTWGSDPYTMAQVRQNDPAIAQVLDSGMGFVPQAQANQVTGGPENSMIASLNPALYSQIGGGFNLDPIRAQYAATAAARQAEADYTGVGGPSWQSTA